MLRIKFYFILFIFLISCSSNNKEPSEGLPLEIVNIFSSEITDVSSAEVLQYYCNKKANDSIELSLLKIAYLNMNGETKIGDLIIAKDLSLEVVEIFKEIYNCKFPIEKMRTINNYNCNDDLSMEDNNTSAFNYRMVRGSRKLSDHSYGRAIDLNPLLNPFVTRKKVYPENGRKYIDRENHVEGMIQKNDCVVRAFKSRGWHWGGDWKYSKDYQHFYKN